MEENKPSTTELTNQYLKEHPHIKNCLAKGLINYSALSRLISKDLEIQKKTSKEAILIAARRFREKLKENTESDIKIQELLSNSQIEAKNKILVYILERNINLKTIVQIQDQIWQQLGVFYLLQGSNHYTIIIQENNSALIEKHFKDFIIKKSSNLVMVFLKSTTAIEVTKGVVSYLTGLFAENGVNILEFFSCWTDTILIIKSEDMQRALSILNF